MSRGVSGKLSKAKTERLLELLTEEYPALRRSCGVAADTCVLASHIAVETVRAAGGRARPFAVTVQAFSAEMVRRMEAGEEVPTEEEPERYAEWIEAGATGCVVGHPDAQCGPDRYNGHLCALVAERYLVDLSADQLGVRHGDVVVPPFWTIVGREFVRGEEPVGFTAASGTVAIYRPRPEDRSYLQSYEGQTRATTWRTEPQIARGILRRIGWRG